MRRGILILVAGLVAGVLAFCCSYRLGTAKPRALLRSAQPELAWLKHEFNLSDAEFRRVSELHTGYLPQCKDRCRRIEELNDKLSRLLGKATQMTPELEQALNERAQIRALCQAEMLKHFFAVSHTMPPEQGQRYLVWVRANTCLTEKLMSHEPLGGNETAMPARHP
jgi:hypothetical protein